MTTNFFHVKEPCKCCGRGDRVFIGKSAAGWKFNFRQYHGLTTWREWKNELAAGGRIIDEYGKEHSPEEFESWVENKQDGLSHAQRYPDGSYEDDEGYVFSEYAFE